MQTLVNEFIARKDECASSNIDTINNVDLLNSTFEEGKSKLEVPQRCPEQSKVLRPVRARKRKLSAQRQGLSYLEQLEIKKRDQMLEEKKIVIEEAKIRIEERKMELAEKRFQLDEYEKKKTLQILEDRLASEIEQKKDMTKIIERQDKLLEMLILQMQK